MRIVFCLVLAILVAPVAGSQTGETPLEPGARALLFQVGPDLTLRSFSGGTLSLKWHQSEASARRLGVTVALDARTNEDDGSIFRSQDRQSVTVGASLLFLTHRRSRTPVYLYYGLGPTGSVSFNRTEIDNVIPSDDGSEGVTRTFTGASLGVAGAVGVEWVVAPAISVTGEYGGALTGMYVRSTISDRPSGDEGASNDLGLSLQTGGARLGVSVYF